MNGSDAEHALETVIRWVMVREHGGLPMPSSYGQLIEDIRHSALLRRMLSGREPLEVPPPRSYGQPWYSLVDEGEASGCELKPLMDRAGATPHVSINESAWRIVDRGADGAYIVQYARQAPLYVATPHAGDAPGWELRRLDVALMGTPTS